MHSKPAFVSVFHHIKCLSVSTRCQSLLFVASALPNVQDGFYRDLPNVQDGFYCDLPNVQDRFYRLFADSMPQLESISNRTHPLQVYNTVPLVVVCFCQTGFYSGRLFDSILKYILLSYIHLRELLLSLLINQILLCCWEGSIDFSSRLRSDERLSIPIGGGRQYLFPNSSIVPSIVLGGDQLTPDHVFRFVDHVDDMGRLAYPLGEDFVYANLTLAVIVLFLSKQMVQKIARIHKVPFSLRWNLAEYELVNLFEGHSCVNCILYTSVLESHLSTFQKKRDHSVKVFAALTEEEKIE